MAQSITDLLPPPEDAVDLEREELAVLLLRHLVEVDRPPGLHLRNYFGSPQVSDYCDEIPDRKLTRALTEAWMWLEHEGMLAPLVEHGRDWVFVTRLGHQLLSEQSWEGYRRASILTGFTLVPALVQKVLPAFHRGDYDAAVFQAFKEVEVQVRRAAELSNELLGVELMRKAFHPDEGALADASAVPAERQAISHLFAGAIGTFKNPGSHREVDVNDPQEAAEAILLANHLLKIVERRTSDAQHG